MQRMQKIADTQKDLVIFKQLRSGLTNYDNNVTSEQSLLTELPDPDCRVICQDCRVSCHAQEQVARRRASCQVCRASCQIAEPVARLQCQLPSTSASCHAQEPVAMHKSKLTDAEPVAKLCLESDSVLMGI